MGGVRSARRERGRGQWVVWAVQWVRRDEVIWVRAFGVAVVDVLLHCMWWCLLAAALLVCCSAGSDCAGLCSVFIAISVTVLMVERAVLL